MTGPATIDVTRAVGAAAARPWAGDDFPDWLPPMLVRELRQGLQAGAFFWTFLLIQLCLALLLVFAVLGNAGAAGEPAGQAIEGLVWMSLWLVVGLVIPLRGLTAIAAERTGNNLDLVRLTRLSAARIVVGKWVAIIAQAALVAVSVLPYLVLRYFFGGVDVMGDLTALGWLLVVAAVVAAVALYLSTRPTRERTAAVVAVVLFGFSGVNLLFRASLSGFASSGNAWFWLSVAAVYALAFLEAAAASIAPPAENHALPKRLIGLGCAAAIAVAGVFGWGWSFSTVAWAFGLPLVFLAVGAICERPVRYRRLHAAFARGGVVGRAAAAIFTPGWATALLFVTLAGGLVALGCLAAASDDGRVWPFVTLGAATLVFPLPLLLFVPRLEYRGTLYGAVQAVSLLPWLAAAAIENWSGPGPTSVVAPFPLAAMLRLVTWDAGEKTRGALLAAGGIVACIVLAIVARSWIREMRQTQRLVTGRRSA